VPSLYPEEASANLPSSGTVSVEEAFYIYPVDSSLTEFARSLRSDLGRIFSDEVRRRVASSFPSVFLKTHELPYPSYFDREAVIYVVRHPAAVVWSYFNYLRDHGPAPGISLEDVIRGRVPFGSWSEHVTAWLEASAKLGDRLILSRFEELAANHEPLLDRIAALTGLRIVEATASFPTFSYWHEIAPQFYRAGDDDTWKAHLGARDLDLIQSLHGPAMARLGYGL